jgi:hypothetical protein
VRAADAHGVRLPATSRELKMSTLTRSGCAVVAALIGLVGCARPHYHPIPAGTYKSSVGDESVSVSGSGLEFHVRSYDHDWIVLEGPYDYTVKEDGKLVADIFTSGGHVNVYACREWYWNGREIIQVGCKNGEIRRFEPQDVSQ